MVRRWTAKSPERATPRPRAQQGHPQKYADEVRVDWSCYWGMRWPAWETPKLCPLHPRAPKFGCPDKKVCLACIPNLRAGGAVGGPCRPSSAQLPDTAISELFAHGLPHLTDTAGLPKLFAWPTCRVSGSGVRWAGQGRQV
eukprot:1160619-Pelagomonas_calceolata.AAC.5